MADDEKKEVQGMTDKQFLHHLQELREIASHSDSLEEFIKTLDKLIDSYKQ